MRMRWRVVSPIIGLLLFIGGSYNSWRFNREFHANSRYFWWSSMRLDSDPLNRHPRPRTSSPCKEETEGSCVEWDPEYIWIDPGWLAKSFVLSALPAFLLGSGIVRSFARLGVSEVTTFMIS